MDIFSKYGFETFPTNRSSTVNYKEKLFIGTMTIHTYSIVKYSGEFDFNKVYIKGGRLCYRLYHVKDKDSVYIYQNFIGSEDEMCHHLEKHKLNRVKDKIKKYESSR